MPAWLQEMAATLAELASRTKASILHANSLAERCFLHMSVMTGAAQEKAAVHSAAAALMSTTAAATLHAHAQSMMRAEAACDAYLEGQHSHNAMHLSLLNNRAQSHLALPSMVRR